MDKDNENLPTNPEGKTFNRRDFFSFLKKPFNKDQSSSSTIEIQPEISQVKEAPILTRQQFLQVLIGTSAALAAGTYLNIRPTNAQTEDNTKSELDKIKSDQNKEDEDTLEDDPSFKDTLIESSLYTFANEVSKPIYKKLKIPVGNAGLDEKKIRELMEKPFAQNLLEGALIAPAIEETVFRALPQLFTSNDSKEKVWEVGVPVSAVFALLHNIKRDAETDKLFFSTEVIPLQQFIGGLFYWKLMRERGLSHAVLAHSMVNTSALTVAKILYEAYPEKYQRSQSEDNLN